MRFLCHKHKGEGCVELRSGKERFGGPTHEFHGQKRGGVWRRKSSLPFSVDGWLELGNIFLRTQFHVIFENSPPRVFKAGSTSGEKGESGVIEYEPLLCVPGIISWSSLKKRSLGWIGSRKRGGGEVGGKIHSVTKWAYHWWCFCWRTFSCAKQVEFDLQFADENIHGVIASTGLDPMELRSTGPR